MYIIMFVLCNNFEINRVKKPLQKQKQNGCQLAILNEITQKNGVHWVTQHVQSTYQVGMKSIQACQKKR